MVANQPSENTKKPIGILIAAGCGVVIIIFALYWLISAQQARSLQQQIFQVLPGASQLQQLQYSNEDGWQPLTLDSETPDSLYAGYDESGQLIGYAIPGEGQGYEAPVRLLYGVQPEQRIILGLLVLETGETPGWGDKDDKEFADRGFAESFRSLPVEPKLVLVEAGAKDLPNEIDMMTGATITSEAIVRTLNTTNRRWLPRLPDAGSSESY